MMILDGPIRVLFATWLALATLTTPPAADQPVPGDLYLALGDSVAAGIGATLPSLQGYARRLTTLLERQRQAPVELTNLAEPGETTATFLDDQLPTALDIIAATTESGQRVSPITLTLGANDLIQTVVEGEGNPFLTLFEVDRNLGDIMTAIAEAATSDAQPAPTLIVTTYYDPTDGDPTALGTEAWWAKRLNTIIRSQAAATGWTVADIAAAFAGQGADLTEYPRDLHPNNDGHQVIARTIWRSTNYDRTPPNVMIEDSLPLSLPGDRSAVVAQVTDQVGVTRVELVIDDEVVTAMHRVGPSDIYVGFWEADEVSIRSTLTVRGLDAAGNFGTGMIDLDSGLGQETGSGVKTRL